MDSQFSRVAHSHLCIHKDIHSPPGFCSQSQPETPFAKRRWQDQRKSLSLFFLVCVSDLDYSHLELQVDKESLKGICLETLLSVKWYFNLKASWVMVNLSHIIEQILSMSGRDLSSPPSCSPHWSFPFPPVSWCNHQASSNVYKLFN